MVGEAVAVLPLQGVIDMGAESARLKKEIGKLDGEIARIDGKLSNEAFVAKAPEDVIEEQREKRADYDTQRGKLKEALSRLAAA